MLEQRNQNIQHTNYLNDVKRRRKKGAGEFSRHRFVSIGPVYWCAKIKCFGHNKSIADSFLAGQSGC